MTNRNLIQSTTILLAATLSLPAFAEDTQPPKPLQWVASIGLTFGGDDLATAETDDGDYKDDVEAGGLIYLGGGLRYNFADSPFSIQGVLGYHFDFVDADNGDASFTRNFFDLLGIYRFGQHCIGLGATQHFNTEYEIDSDVEDLTADLDDASGFIIEYTYLASPYVGISVRYTDIEYEFSDYDVEPVDGNNIGIFINGYF